MERSRLSAWSGWVPGQQATLRPEMTSFRLPSCTTWGHGGTWHINLDIKEAATGSVARNWEEYDSVLSMTSTSGRPTPSSSTAAALGPALAHGENSKPGRKMQPRVNGGLTTGVCWAPLQFTGIADLLHGMLDPLLGACVGLEGEHVRGGSTPGRHWAAES